MNNACRALVGGLLLAVVVSSICAESVLSKTYDDRRTGLVVHFPSNWNIDSDGPAFAIVSFPLSQRPRQWLVPVDGAQIVVMCPPKGVVDIAGWLYSDRVFPDDATRCDLAMNCCGTIAATRVDERVPESAIPGARSTSYYFALGKRLYKADLFYRGRTREEYFKSVLLAVVKNLERGKAPSDEP